jgi:hypothetical protein
MTAIANYIKQFSQPENSQNYTENFDVKGVLNIFVSFLVHVFQIPVLQISYAV